MSVKYYNLGADVSFGITNESIYVRTKDYAHLRSMIAKIIDKFIISTLNILLKICERIDKIRRTLWK